MKGEIFSRTSGGKMIGKARKDRIAQRVEEHGFISSAELAEEFGVSEMTVRRDLTELESQGAIKRTHGGAVVDETKAARAALREPFFDERHGQNRASKLRMAAAAARLVGPSQAVALDVGTSTYALAEELADRPDIRIVTNNLRIAMLTGECTAEIYVLGGRVRQKEMSLCGPVAVEQLRKLRFNVAFIGVSAVSAGGIFDYSIEETDLKKIYLEQSGKKVVLADHTKFNLTSLVQIGDLKSFDTLVTDAVPPADLLRALEAAGVDVVVAAEGG